MTTNLTPLGQRIGRFETANKLRQTGNYHYFRTIESEQDTVVTIAGKKILMFGSNSYLGLTNHPKVKEASQAAIAKYGSGCAGSSFLNGTLDIHLELQERLANYIGKESALVFSTGFQVNVGVIPAITGRNDFIIMDEYNHACIIDGARLSFAKKLKYAHNDVADLERILQKLPKESIKLICFDGVFSMEGDVAPLEKIVHLARAYNANIYLDDAHGLGVLGQGRGTAAEFNRTDDVDLIMGTFSKSLASIGGYVAASHEMIDYLKHNARSFMFSASLAPANAASAMAALEILENEPERVAKLWENTAYAKNRLSAAGFDIGHSAAPIIPIYTRDNIKSFQMTKRLHENGVFVNPVVSPAVPANSSLLRYTLMATHTIDQIDESIDKIGCVARDLGVL